MTRQPNARSAKPNEPAPRGPRAPRRARTADALHVDAAPVFLPAAQRFIGELAKRQDRAWVAAHKAELQSLLLGPLEAVLREVAIRVLDAFPQAEDGAPKVFRIHRDVRFSKDKAPFKDHVAGQVPLGAFSFYFHVDAKSAFAGVGPWQLEPPALKSFRAALQHTPIGPALLRATQKLEAAGYTHTSAGELARAPAGVDPAHPCIQLLRHKGYALMFPAPPKATLVDGTLPQVLAKQLVQCKPALDLVAQTLAFRA